MKKNTLLWIFGIALVVVLGLYFQVPQKFGLSTASIPGAPATAAAPAQPLSVAAPVGVVNGQNPSYTYTSVDSKQPSNSVPGTTYIKSGSLAPVTSLSGPQSGVGIQFWNSNATAFCDVVDANSNPISTSQASSDISSQSPAVQGTHALQSQCYLNVTTLTLSAYNSPANQLLTNGGGAQNLSTGVGATNVQLYYQGTAKQSSMPFGGCVAIEAPINVTSIAISGAGISGAPCPYAWTYQVSSTSDMFKLYAVPAGFDQNGAADLKAISLQFTAATNKPGGKFYVTFMPANWYVGNDKAFHLDIEKAANGDTTKTFGGVGLTSFQGQ